MSVIKEQHGSYAIQATGAIESIALDKPKATFRKLWIYPAKGISNGGLVANGALVTIGKDGDGVKVVTDPLNPGDLPLKIELPEATGETMHLSDIVISGTQGDGVFYSYWP
jgi:hypothetical protein